MNQELYHGGSSFKAIGEDFSTLENLKHVIPADVLDAWFDPSPKVINAITQYLQYLLKMSPPTHGDGLIRAISEKRKVGFENIAIGSGSSGLMFVLFPFLLKNGDTALILDPTYSEYGHIFKNVLNITTKKYVLRKENNFRIDFEELKQSISKENPKVVVIVNPNSPTGQYWNSENIVRLSTMFPETTFVVDETYIEYVGKQYSLESFAANSENVIVLKSMSKMYALSGARVGYLIAHKDIAQKIKALLPPWSVGLLGQVAAVEALHDEEYYLQKYKETHELREEFIKNLRTISGVTIYDSVGNYFLVELENGNASLICSELAKEGVFIRRFPQVGVDSGEKFVRIAVRNKEENQRMYEAIRNITSIVR